MAPASMNLPAVLVDLAAQSPVSTSAAAPTTTTKAPNTVSMRSYAMNRGVMRLSTMFDC
jgi:hypothetical protein